MTDNIKSRAIKGANIEIKELRRRVHNELHWCLSGVGYSGKTHIAKEKGNTNSLCGVSVDTKYCHTAWSNLCKRCRSIAETHLMDLPNVTISRLCPDCHQFHPSNKACPETAVRQ